MPVVKKSVTAESEKEKLRLQLLYDAPVQQQLLIISVE